MPSNETTTKFKADISQLKAQMQAASRAVRVATSEFKASTAGMDNWSRSATGLSAKLKQLDTTLGSQKTQLSLLESELEKTVKVYGENSAAADNVRIKINNQKAAIANTQKQINQYSKDLEDCKNGVGKFANEQDKMATATGKLKAEMSGQESKLSELKARYVELALTQGENSDEAKQLASEIKQLSSELVNNRSRLQSAEESADRFDESLEDMDDSSESATQGFTVMKGVLADLVATGIKKAISGMIELGKQTFAAGANFESSMSKVGAISGASAQDMEKLRAKAKEMGETTQFSASESAEALQYMAMAGWSTDDMLNGLSGVMNLAAASGEDLATTSDIVTDALTAMGYKAGDAGHLADVMAAASSNANTNVGLMGKTFQYAAPIVGALGYKMEDTAVAIGLMANAGIKGDKAGTALRSILTRLSSPPKECADAMKKLGISLTDSNGKMKSLDQVMGELRGAFSNLSETQKTQYAKSIAGQEAMSGLLAIVNAAPEDFDKLTKAVNNSNGASEKMAKTMNNNVNGQITLLKSNIEGKMIKVFEKASGSIQKAIKQMSKALDSVNWDKVADGVGALAKKFADFVTFLVKNASTVKKVLEVIAIAMTTAFAVNKIATFTSAIQTIAPLFVTLAAKIGLVTVATDAQTAATTALNTAWLASPITWVVAGLVAVGAALYAYSKHVDDQIKKEYGLSKAQKECIENSKALKSEYDDMNKTRTENSKAVTAEYGHLQELKNEYNGLIDSNGQVKQGYEDRANFILNELAKSMGVEVDQIKQTIDANGKLGASIDQIIQKKQAEAMLNANQDAYNEAIKKRSDALSQYTKAQKTASDAEKKWKDAQSQAMGVQSVYNELMKTSPEAAKAYLIANSGIIKGAEEAKKAYEKAKKGLKDSEDAYVGYNATIQNYEGLSSAIISGDANKISQAMANMQSNFITAETGTRESLERQVKNLQKTYKDMETALKNGTPGVTQEMVNQAKSMVDAAQTELNKLPPEADKSGKKAGKNYSDGVGSNKGNANKAGKDLADNAKAGAQSGEGSMGTSGTKSGMNYASGVNSQAGNASNAGRALGANVNAGVSSIIGQLQNTGAQSGAKYGSGVNSKAGDARNAGRNVANNAKAGAESVDASPSGRFFSQGFINGIGSLASSVGNAARNIANIALGALKKAGKEGSPWKTTIQSGKWFGEGFDIGINYHMKEVVKSATKMAINAYDAIDLETKNVKELGLNVGSDFSNGLKASMLEVKSSVKGLATPLNDIKVPTPKLNAKINPGDDMQGTTSPTNQGTTIINKNVTYNQYNNSPKALDRLSIYRDTNSLLFDTKARLSDV